MTTGVSRLVLATLALAAAFFASAPCYAQGYVGVGSGPSRIDIDPWPLGCGGPSTKCDTDSIGYKVYGGWNIVGPWAIEAAYFDWGKASSAWTIANIATTLATRTRGIGFGGAYTHLFGPGRCYARVGIARNIADTDRTDYLRGIVVQSHKERRSTEAYYGFGCGYSLAPAFLLTADADFSRAQYTASEQARMRLLTIGLRFSF